MDDDPIVALKRPYKAPSSALEGSSRGINIGINIARTESPYFNNSNYNASSNSYKRQKLDSRIYKDEETTGYEEDGTEASWINDGAGAGKASIVPGINGVICCLKHSAVSILMLESCSFSWPQK